MSPAAKPDPEHAGHASAAGTGHDRHEGHSVAMFRDKFWLSLALTIPVVVWSPDLEHWFGYTAPTFPGSALIPPVLGTVVFLYGGLVFLRGARGELADRSPGMMTLISLAILVAFVTSWAGTATRPTRLAPAGDAAFPPARPIPAAPAPTIRERR